MELRERSVLTLCSLCLCSYVRDAETDLLEWCHFKNFYGSNKNSADQYVIASNLYWRYCLYINNELLNKLVLFVTFASISIFSLVRSNFDLIWLYCTWSVNFRSRGPEALRFVWRNPTSLVLPHYQSKKIEIWNKSFTWVRNQHTVACSYNLICCIIYIFLGYRIF